MRMLGNMDSKNSIIKIMTEANNLGIQVFHINKVTGNTNIYLRCVGKFKGKDYSYSEKELINMESKHKLDNN